MWLGSDGCQLIYGQSFALADMEDDLIFCFTQSRIIKGDGARDESKVRPEDDDMTLIDLVEASPRKKKTFVR